MKKFKIFGINLLLAGFFLTFLALPTMLPNVAKGQNATVNPCDKFEKSFLIYKGENKGTTAEGGAPVNVLKGLPKFCSATELILWAIERALILAGIIATAFLIFGGYLYLAAGGSEEQSEKGRKVLINSIIGLVVIIMSGAIVRVLANLFQGNKSVGG